MSSVWPVPVVPVYQRSFLYQRASVFFAFLSVADACDGAVRIACSQDRWASRPRDLSCFAYRLCIGPVSALYRHCIGGVSGAGYARKSLKRGWLSREKGAEFAEFENVSGETERLS